MKNKKKFKLINFNFKILKIIHAVNIITYKFNNKNIKLRIHSTI